MSLENATAKVRGLVRGMPRSLPVMETGLLVLMIILAAAGSLGT